MICSKEIDHIHLPIRISEKNCILTVETYFHTNALLPMWVFNSALRKLIETCVGDQRFNGGSVWVRLDGVEGETKVNRALLTLKSKTRVGGEDVRDASVNGTESHVAEVSEMDLQES